MTETDVFIGTEMADAMLADIRSAVGDRTLRCCMVRDDGSRPAQAYAARLVDAGRKAGVIVSEVNYADIAQVLVDPALGPVILLHPAPAGVDLPEVIEALGPARDAEGLHPANLGKLASGVHDIVPPTARAAMLVARHLVGPLSGKRIAIVGASPIVGLPLAILLMEAGATVRIAQETTEDLAAETRDADVVISATGVVGLIGADHIAEGAFVIDVGVTRVAGKLVGDVDQDAVVSKAAVITHVPDGVGPVTAACLFENILALRQRTNGE